MTAADEGRNDLAEWLDDQPTNFFQADATLRHVLHRIGGDGTDPVLLERLDAFGAACATTLDAAAAVNNRPHNLPVLERYDGVGRRTEGIEHHPSYHTVGELIYGSAMMGEYARPGGFVRSLAFFHLSSMCGEAGHNCPVACTAGIIKSLQGLGSPELRDRYLPGLLTPDYAQRLDGAQFLTEVQGGSDVGVNAVRARPAEDGTWRIHGEKWFCSNADADLILMTARFDEETRGTRGLGLFLVPRRLEDGRVNAFTLRRLKDKLGTRSMPSAEIDFEGAIAWPLGTVEEGFRNMMRFVINTSRIYNAVAVTGIARRAYFVAEGYARHRRAFDRRIIAFPLVRETIDRLAATSAAISLGTWELIPLMDRSEQGQLDDEEAAFLRMAINVNKRRSSITATECALQGIEVLGGNGAIESFSILPRLLRDAIVCENWEGTHNTLTAQVLRDMHRYRLHDAYIAQLRKRFAALETTTSAAYAPRGLRALDQLESELAEVMSLDEDSASLRMRPMMDRMAWLLYGAAMATQAAHDASAGLGDDIARLVPIYWALRGL